MDKTEAYRIVYEDLMTNGSPLLRGIHDAIHGDRTFLLGMSAVMDEIAGRVNDETAEQYHKVFTTNYFASVKKAEAYKARKEKED